jgi:hypothetical protein
MPIMGSVTTMVQTGLRRLRGWALTGTLAAGASFVGCSDSPMDAGMEGPARPHDARVFSVPSGQAAFTALLGAAAYFGTYEGVHGPASYRIEVPESWNGVLVMYAHGYRGQVAELTVSFPPAIREHLLDQGYAWAASSYSANYYDVRAGVEDTNALALAFPTLTGRSAPTKYYVVGRSMGGHVAGAAVERETLERAASRVSYAAALPMCGVMADNELGDYYHAFAIAAYELAGYRPSSFPISDFDARLPAIKQALWVDYASDRDAMTTQGKKLRNALMHLSGGSRPTFLEGFGVYLDLLFDRGSGDGTWSGILPGVSTNTSDIVYQLDTEVALSDEEDSFNADVFRVEGDFPSQNPLRGDGVRLMPILEGRFDVPVLSVHTLEARVPLLMEQIYAERAAANGNASHLVQRVIRSPYHCDFSPEESITAFDALVAWERDGVVPLGDDVLDLETVADPTYGCTFTTETRPGIPAC